MSHLEEMDTSVVWGKLEQRINKALHLKGFERTHRVSFLVI